MKIAQNGINKITANPSAGDVLSPVGGLGDLYAQAADKFYTNQLPIVAISPAVLNCDERVFYTFPTSGTTTMLGRQTSGLWAGEDDTAAGNFRTGNFCFDSKLAIEDIKYYDRLYFYQLGDGDDTLASTRYRNDLDIDDLSGTDYNYLDPSPRRFLLSGDPFSYNLDEAPYSKQDPAVEKYELVYGSNNAANYGPFNMSTSDLVSVASLSNQKFRQVKNRGSSADAEDDRGEVRGVWFRDIFEATPTEDVPWTLDSTIQDVRNADQINVHVLTLHITTQGQGA